MGREDDFDSGDRAGIFESILDALNVRTAIEERGSVFSWMLVGVALLLTVSVLWYSYPREKERQEIASTPLIQAESGPYKVAPADPGGMQIANRDSTVFDVLRQGQEEGAGKVENLLDEEEKPMAREELFAGLKADVVEDVSESPASNEPEDVEGEEAEDVTPPIRDQSQPAVSRSAIEKPVVAVAEKIAKTEPAAGTEEPKVKGRFLVQLGSLKSKAEAEKAWAGFQKSFPAQLEDLSLHVQEADLGAKGTYYRVQAGPVEEAQAKSICKAVTAKKPGGCLVVKN